MTKELFSLRMRAAQQAGNAGDERHISGAEGLAAEDEVAGRLLALWERARLHERGKADVFHLTVERVELGQIRRCSTLPVSTIRMDEGVKGCRQAAVKLLQMAGVPEGIACLGVQLLVEGPYRGRVMRGAVLLDVAGGARLEPDPARGVRVSRMDLAPGLEEVLTKKLAALGIAGKRVKDALVLASKVQRAPGMVAELCWSDDPGYVTGYVASSRLGYVRLPQLKEQGDERGGRIFFLCNPGTELEELIHYLELRPVLLDRLGDIRPPETWPAYLQRVQV